MNLKEIEEKSDEIIHKLHLDNSDVFDALKVASAVVLIYVVYKLWRKSRG